ncbi:hypothetical protein MINT15_30930 [Saccharomonospora viridis]|uniref:Uncharacterized protein n=1 Tax=Saccharomonospora viridis TaxID=1852 RepID=A0A837D8I7_9PSEU|nr:hypothetical protein MINT15_30930 [Saccharomonospora viridis]
MEKVTVTLKFLTICCEVGSPDRYITGESPPRAWRARMAERQHDSC